MLKKACEAIQTVYTRVTGYYRPTKNFNDGKAQEFKDRKLDNLNGLKS